jgi:hypothetical protein
LKSVISYQFAQAAVQKNGRAAGLGGSAAARKRDFSGFGREVHACRQLAGDACIRDERAGKNQAAKGAG